MLNNKVFVHWFKNEKLGPNFGDELNHYLIEKLSGKKLQYVPVVTNRLIIVVRVFINIIKGKVSITNYIHKLKAFIYNNTFKFEDYFSSLYISFYEPQLMSSNFDVLVECSSFTS